MDEKTIARFWSKVDKRGPDDCWMWSAGINVGGYGAFQASGRCHPAHRISFSLANGDIPPGAFICHRCDVRACVNPGHLFLGDAAINRADAVAKRRHSYGARNGRAKLTDADVIAIRAAAASSTRADMARRYGVSEYAIYAICTNKHWRHLS